MSVKIPYKKMAKMFFCIFNLTFLSSISYGYDILTTIIGNEAKILHFATPETCNQEITSYLSQLASINWSDISNEELKTYATSNLATIWKTRKELHDRLSELPPECALSARELFHQMRDISDYLGEFAYPKIKNITPDKIDFKSQPTPIYDRESYAPYFVDPRYDDSQFMFHPGDLVLARGVSFISAIIAQLTNNKSQFSHLILMSEDAKHNPMTIESYVGIGVSTYDIVSALRNENARLLVLRPKNKTLGEKSSTLMREKVYEQRLQHHTIPYDYNMNFVDHSAMSCAEVGSAAYEWASGKSIMLPTYPSVVNIHNADFLESMNLVNGNIFTPADLEVDPNFELVLDWQDYRLTRDSRQRDAVLDSMIQWIDSENYVFYDTFTSSVLKNIIMPMRPTYYWPIFEELPGIPQIDLQSPPNVFGTMAVLKSVAETLLEKLRKADQHHIDQFSRPMTSAELRKWVSEFKKTDLENFKTGKYSFIHNHFHPKGLSPVSNSGDIN